MQKWIAVVRHKHHLRKLPQINLQSNLRTLPKIQPKQNPPMKYVDKTTVVPTD